jgi:hypothetical protein
MEFWLLIFLAEKEEALGEVSSHTECAHKKKA